MLNFQKSLLYFNTIRHLRAVQIYGRLWHKFRSPAPNLDPPPQKGLAVGHWEAPALREQSLYGPHRFRMLNQEHPLEENGGWEPPEGDVVGGPSRRRFLTPCWGPFGHRGREETRRAERLRKSGRAGGGDQINSTIVRVGGGYGGGQHARIDRRRTWHSGSTTVRPDQAGKALGGGPDDTNGPGACSRFKQWSMQSPDGSAEADGATWCSQSCVLGCE